MIVPPVFSLTTPARRNAAQDVRSAVGSVCGHRRAPGGLRGGVAGRGVGPHPVDDDGERVPAPHQGLHQGKGRGAVSCLFGACSVVLYFFFFWVSFCCVFVDMFYQVSFFFCTRSFFLCVFVDCFFVEFGEREDSGGFGDGWRGGVRKRG